MTNRRVERIKALLHSLPSKPIQGIIFKKMHPTIKDVYEQILPLPNQELWLCNQNLWIYHGAYKPSWGWEKEDDNIFHRVNFGHFHIQWWDFPNKSYPEIAHLTQWFNKNCKSPKITKGSR